MFEMYMVVTQSALLTKVGLPGGVLQESTGVQPPLS